MSTLEYQSGFGNVFAADLSMPDVVVHSMAFMFETQLVLCPARQVRTAHFDPARR